MASHGYRWIDYEFVDEDDEREHIHRSVRIHEQLIGKRPVGMYQGKVSFYIYIYTYILSFLGWGGQQCKREK